MVIKDTNIFFNKAGNPMMLVRQGANFINTMIEAPADIGEGVLIAVKNIGAFSFINMSSRIRFVNRVGRFCSIGPDCVIGLPPHPINTISTSNFLFKETYKPFMTSFKYDEFDSYRSRIRETEPTFSSKEIIIGNDVWIGQSVKIMNGITIGDGAIIGAGAVVTKDVEPYSIVGGVPARMIRKRFSDNIIEKLLELRWWEYGPDILCGIDLADLTMNQLNKIEDRIKDGFPKWSGIQYKFSEKERTIQKIEDGKIYTIYSECENKIKAGGISRGVAEINYFNKECNIYGWFLPSYAYDSIRIYDGQTYLGNADLHILRKDVEQNFPEYGEARSGWKFRGRLKETANPELSLYCIKDNKEIYSIDNISYKYITPQYLLDKYYRGTENNVLLYKWGEHISIWTDNSSFKMKLKDKFIKYSIDESSKKCIVCTRDWKEDIVKMEKEGMQGLPFWLWCICNKNMLNYNSLKKVSKEMGMKMGELLKWIKAYYHKKIVLVYGNGQILSLNTLITSSTTLMNEWILIDMLPVQDIAGEEKNIGFQRNFLQEIDVLIYQNVDPNNNFSEKLATSEIKKGLNKDARTVCIPNVYFTGYFPQLCSNPYNPPKEKYGLVPFPYGDINIQNMEGKYSAEEIAEIIGTDTFYTAEMCIKNAEDSIDELEKRETSCDIKISDYIRDNYKKTSLFYTANHPNNIVLEELLKRIVRFLGGDICDIDRSKSFENNGREIFIYPSVQKNLQLEFGKEKYCWWNKLKKEPSTLREYVEDYLKYCSKFKNKE